MNASIRHHAAIAAMTVLLSMSLVQMAGAVTVPGTQQGMQELKTVGVKLIVIGGAHSARATCRYRQPEKEKRRAVPRCGQSARAGSALMHTCSP